MKRSGVNARGSRAAAAAAAAAITMGLAACSTMSPATITTPYPAADGTSGTIPGSGIKLSNFLVVSAAKGQPGQLVGAVANENATPVTLTMQTDLGPSAQFTQTKIQVPAYGSTQVGPSGTQIVVADTPVVPGALMGISANTASSGGVTLSVPVVTPTGYYSDYTVTPEPAATSTTPSAAPTTRTRSTSGSKSGKASKTTQPEPSSTATSS